MTPHRWELGIIPCTATKNPTGLTARTLYAGPLFPIMMRHAVQRCDRILIMSAKYGLLDLDDPVEHYEAYLPDLDGAALGSLFRKLHWQALGLEFKGNALSYLPKVYHGALIVAAPLLASRCSRPYADLGMFHLPTTLIREAKNYGSHPSRR